MIKYVAVSAVLCSFLHIAAGFVLSFPPMTWTNNVWATRDGLYGRWENSSRILYYIDGSYDAQETGIIQSALIVISLDMNLCVQFQEYNPDHDFGQDFIYISKTLNDGSTPPTCVTFGGRLLRAKGQGQKMVIRGGPNGCLGSAREVMKVFANALGLRNEYRRPDRDQYIKVTPANLLPELSGSTLLTVYNSSDVTYAGFPFDYHSVTLPTMVKYAMNGTRIWELPSGTSIPYMDRLSQQDCMGLSMIYPQCKAANCRDPYNMYGKSEVTRTSPTPTLQPQSRTARVDTVSNSTTVANQTNAVMESSTLSPSTTFVTRFPPRSTTESVFHMAALDQSVADNANLTSVIPTPQINVAIARKDNPDRTMLAQQNMTIAAPLVGGGPVTFRLENDSNMTTYVAINDIRGEVVGTVNGVDLTNYGKGSTAMTTSTTLGSTVGTIVNVTNQPIVSSSPVVVKQLFP